MSREYPENYGPRVDFFRKEVRKNVDHFKEGMIIAFAQGIASGEIDPTNPDHYDLFRRFVPYGPDRWTDWTMEDKQDLLKHAGIRPKYSYLFGNLRWNPSRATATRLNRYSRANPAPPRQTTLHHDLVIKLRNTYGARGGLALPVYMEDLQFANDGSLPKNIEKGIVDLEDRGYVAAFVLNVRVSKKKGKPQFTPVYDPKPRNPTKDLQDFPFVADIEIYNWPSPQAELDLLHELDHVAQWIGTGLIRVAEDEPVQSAFDLEVGSGLYGLPKKKYRMYQEVPDVQPTGMKERLRQELSYDEEFYPYVQDIAAEIQRTGQSVDEYFADLADMMDRRPGSAARWENLKKQVKRLVESR